MKNKIFAALIMVFLASLLLPTANAWFHPGNPPSEDFLHNQYGPMTPHLLITPYDSNEAEWTAFLASDIDFMDWPLLAAQKEELDTSDPNEDVYGRAFYLDRGMYQFDLNNMRYPCNNLQFRKALAHSFDKATFVATQLAGLGFVMDTPLQWSTAWANPYCTGLYPYSLATAASILDAAGFVDSDSDGWREGPGNEEIFLEVYIRQDDPDRTAMGLMMCSNLESIGIECNELVVSKTTCYQKVMVDFDYDLYTGSWKFNTDPDVLYFPYLGEYAQAFPWTANYPGYNNPTFDLHAEAMLTATSIGDELTPSTAKYHVFEMQRVLCDDVGVIPVFTYASYGAFKVGCEKVVNVEGTGPWGWYSLYNTYKEGTNTIRWGFMNDISSLNVMHSGWLWDWQILDKIYDTLINVNPYDVTDDQPWMAKSWELGTWNSGGEDATYIRFHLREDMYWHDIAPKPERQTPHGAPLLQAGAYDVPVTAEDVRFTIYAIRDVEDSYNHELASDVIYCDVEDPYTVTVYSDLYMPLWMLHWIGRLPIMPKHVWGPVFKEETTAEFDPIEQECLSGCGPWVYDFEGTSPTLAYMLEANTRHFRYHPIDLTGRVIGTTKIVKPCTEIHVAFYLHNLDRQRIIAPSEFLIEISKVYPNGTINLLYSGSNPELVYCDPVMIFEYFEHIGEYCLYKIEATITPDPLSGHADQDGYTIYFWSTIPEDINLDFFVNAKDATILGAAYGGIRGQYDYVAEADINGDGFINAKDAVKLGVQFGWCGCCS